MKSILIRTCTSLSAFLLAIGSYAFTNSSLVIPVDARPVTDAFSLSHPTTANSLPTESKAMSLDEFLKLTPKKYRELTGKKLGLKKSIQLKAAQTMLKKGKKAAEGGVSKGLYIVLAIFGLAWIAMGIMDDWSGNNWWLNLILTLLFWLPGFIHAMIKMKDYYN